MAVTNLVTSHLLVAFLSQSPGCGSRFGSCGIVGSFDCGVLGPATPTLERYASSAITFLERYQAVSETPSSDAPEDDPFNSSFVQPWVPWLRVLAKVFKRAVRQGGPPACDPA
jgi:hypothetical protein